MPALIQQLLVQFITVPLAATVAILVYLYQDRRRRAEENRVRYHPDRVRIYSDFLAAITATDPVDAGLEKAYLSTIVVGTPHVQNAATALYVGVLEEAARPEKPSSQVMLDRLVQRIAGFVEETQIELGVIPEVRAGVEKTRAQRKPWWEYWDVRRDESGRIVRRLYIEAGVTGSSSASVEATVVPAQENNPTSD